MADETPTPKAAEVIGRYRRDLLAEGIEGDLLDDLVRNMAWALSDRALAAGRVSLNVDA
jgi:hypothetical protein